MEPGVRELAVALTEIIKQNREAAQIETGDEREDAAFAMGVEAVVGDIEQLLNELGEGFEPQDIGKPYIPHGFRIHAVVTH